MKNKNGLTLVELIAAIAVLAIVLGIVVVNVARIKKNVDKKNRENAIRIVLEGARRYCTETHDCNEKAAFGSPYYTVKKTGKQLKDEGYAKFDKKYDSDPLFSMRVTWKYCTSNPNKKFYTIQIDEAGYEQKYNDCGCEEQEDDGDPIKEICETNNGKY